MPLSTGQSTTPAIRLEFDKTSYAPTDPIHFQVVVEGMPTSVQRDVVFAGEITPPQQQTRQVTGAAQVVETTTYGAFTADGYAVEQDPADPSRYTATPNGG